MNRLFFVIVSSLIAAAPNAGFGQTREMEGTPLASAVETPPGPVIVLALRTKPPRFQEVSFKKMASTLETTAATIALVPVTVAQAGAAPLASTTATGKGAAKSLNTVYIPANSLLGALAIGAAKGLAQAVLEERANGQPDALKPQRAAPAAEPLPSQTLEDPAGIVAAEIAAAFGAKAQAYVRSEPVVVEGDQIGPLLTKAAGARWVVDVATTHWGYQYYSLDLGHFGAIYGAKIRVIDAVAGAVVAQGGCSFTTKKPPSPPTYDQLMANDMAVMRALLVEAAHSCATKIKADTLKL